MRSFMSKWIILAIIMAVVISLSGIPKTHGTAEGEKWALLVGIDLHQRQQ